MTLNLKITAWICGKVIQETPLGQIWDFQGLYTSKDKAIEACKTKNHFIGPAVLNDPVPENQHEWPGAYYPLAENQEGTHGKDSKSPGL
jgi:hypothetical protein